MEIFAKRSTAAPKKEAKIHHGRHIVYIFRGLSWVFKNRAGEIRTQSARAKELFRTTLSNTKSASRAKTVKVNARHLHKTDSFLLSSLFSFVRIFWSRYYFFFFSFRKQINPRMYMYRVWYAKQRWRLA